MSGYLTEKQRDRAGTTLSSMTMKEKSPPCLLLPPGRPDRPSGGGGRFRERSGIFAVRRKKRRIRNGKHE